MNLKYISIFLITFFMVVCSPCIFAENVHEGDLSYADAVINDTADAVDIIIDNAVANNTADDGDIIIDNAVINNTADDEDIIIDNAVINNTADDGDIIIDNTFINSTERITNEDIQVPATHAEVERLAPFTRSIAGKNVDVHSIKVRIVDGSGNGVPNYRVSLYTHYTPYNDRGVRFIDMLVYGTRHTLKTDDNGYVVFNYMISPNPEMSVFCWLSLTLWDHIDPDYLWWDGINHSIYDQSRNFYKK